MMTMLRRHNSQMLSKDDRERMEESTENDELLTRIREEGISLSSSSSCPVRLGGIYSKCALTRAANIRNVCRAMKWFRETTRCWAGLDPGDANLHVRHPILPCMTCFKGVRTTVRPNVYGLSEDAWKLSRDGQGFSWLLAHFGAEVLLSMMSWRMESRADIICLHVTDLQLFAGLGGVDKKRLHVVSS